MYIYSKLCGRITEVFGTQSKFAKHMHLSERSLSLKLNNKVQFKQNEIMKAANLLGIKDNEISLYFFTLYVQQC